MIIVEVEFEPTAAAVLALGVLQLSPIANTFGNLVCCSVSRVTVTKPVAGSAKSLERTASTVDIGGDMCRKPYCRKKNKFVTKTSSWSMFSYVALTGFVKVSFVSMFSNVANFLLWSTSIKCERVVSPMFLRYTFDS